MFPDDFEQSIALACLMTGLRDFNSPAAVDIAALLRNTQRVLYQLGRDMGGVRKGNHYEPPADIPYVEVRAAAWNPTSARKIK